MSLTDRIRALVLRSPNDPEVRGVYADALLEAGDPRGTFVALQSQLTGRLSPDARETAKREADDLLRLHGDDWIEPVRGWAEVRWKSGFIHAIRAKASDFAVKGGALLAVEPVLEVTLTDAKDAELRSLAETAALARVDSISILGAFTDKGAAALLESAHVSGVKALNFSGGSLGPAFGAAASKLRSLRSLCITGMGMGDDGAAALVKGELPHLERLYLARNELSDEGVTALTSARAAAHLKTLCVGGNELSDESGVALAAAKALGELVQLEIDATEIGDEGVLAIAKSRTLRSLKRLGLGRLDIGKTTRAELGKHKGLQISW